MNLQERLESQYNITTVRYPQGEHEMIQIKAGTDFPYMVKLIEKRKWKKTGLSSKWVTEQVFRLYQAYSRRSTMPPKFKMIKDFKDRDSALTAIVKRHNSACAYMPDWQRIDL